MDAATAFVIGGPVSDDRALPETLKGPDCADLSTFVIVVQIESRFLDQMGPLLKKHKLLLKQWVRALLGTSLFLRMINKNLFMSLMVLT